MGIRTQASIFITHSDRHKQSVLLEEAAAAAQRGLWVASPVLSQARMPCVVVCAEPCPGLSHPACLTSLSQGQLPSTWSVCLGFDQRLCTTAFSSIGATAVQWVSVQIISVAYTLSRMVNVRPVEGQAKSVNINSYIHTNVCKIECIQQSLSCPRFKVNIRIPCGSKHKHVDLHTTWSVCVWVVLSELT